MEILLLENIMQLIKSSISKSILYLIFLRIILSLLFAISLSYTIVLWANLKRISIMQADWMRSIDITDKLPNYMLTLFDHLIQFGMLARVKVFADSVQILVLSVYALSKISLSSFWILVGSVTFGVLFLIFIYKIFASVSEKTAKCEQELVVCSQLLTQRGSSGWSELALKPIWMQFIRISNEIQNLYTTRIAASQGMRSVMEFAVFVLVSGGIIIGSGTNVIGIDSNDSILVLLVSSRIAPLAFSIFTNLSALGFGDYARKVYISNSSPTNL